MAPWPASRPLCQPRLLLLTHKHRSPPLPAPAAAEAASPGQEAPSLISYKCLSEGGGLSACCLRVSGRSLTPCRPSAGLAALAKDSWGLPKSGIGTIWAKVLTEETEVRRRSAVWRKSHRACRAWKEASSSFDLLGAFSAASPLKGMAWAKALSVTRPLGPSVEWELRPDAPGRL